MAVRRNPAQSDGDRDGAGDVCGRDPADPGRRGSPMTVRTLRVDRDGPVRFEVVSEHVGAATIAIPDTVAEFGSYFLVVVENVSR